MPPNASTNPETPSTTGQAPTPIEAADVPVPVAESQPVAPVGEAKPELINTVPGPLPAQPESPDTWTQNLGPSTVRSTDPDTAERNQGIMQAAADHLTGSDVTASPPAPDEVQQ